MQMVPAETQEARTDSLPKPQSVTQLDGSVTMASTNGQEENESIGHTSAMVLTASDGQERVQSPEVQVCDGEMPPVPDEGQEIAQPCVSLAEAASTELLLLNVEEALIGEEFAFPFPGPASTLDIQASAGSDQGVQGTCLSPFSSEQMALRAASSVNHSYGGSTTVNALVDTYLPNNPMGQNPPRHFFSDPYEYELEKLRREEEYLKKSYEETTSGLMAELERKMAEARSKYYIESKELDDAYKAKAMEEEVNRGFVESSSLLANAFVSKCSERSESSDLAVIRAAMISQQQQAVQTNTHVNSTAPHRPSVTTVEAPILNPSGLLSHFPSCTTTQPTPMSQLAPRPSVTAAAPPPRPLSQQPAVLSNRPINSTAPPRPSAEPLVPLARFQRRHTSQPRPMSQQAVVQSDTHMNSTTPPPHSVTSVELPTTSHSRSHFPRSTTTQPRPMSQQAVLQSYTHVNSTAPPPPSVTAVELPTTSHSRSHFPRSTTTQPRPMSQQAVVQSYTHMNSTAPPPPSVTAVELPTTSHSRSHFPRRNTTQPSSISQQAGVQSNTNVNPTALARTAVTSEALPRPRPPPIISNVTPSSSQPVYGRVRGPAPHLKPFRSSTAPISAAAAATHPTRLVQEQGQGNSKGGLVYLSDEE